MCESFRIAKFGGRQYNRDNNGKLQRHRLDQREAWNTNDFTAFLRIICGLNRARPQPQPRQTAMFVRLFEGKIRQRNHLHVVTQNEMRKTKFYIHRTRALKANKSIKIPT